MFAKMLWGFAKNKSGRMSHQELLEHLCPSDEDKEGLFLMVTSTAQE